MRRPFLSQDEREWLRVENSYFGACVELKLAVGIFLREIRREYGWLPMLIVKYFYKPIKTEWKENQK